MGVKEAREWVKLGAQEMTLEDLRLSPVPIDGATIHWWSYSAPLEDLVEHQAIYHVETPWDDHPWSNNSSRGVVFVDDWAIESRYRSNDGWRSLGRWRGWTDYLVEQNWSENWWTVEAAVAGLQEMLEGQIQRNRDEAARLQERIELRTSWPWTFMKSWAYCCGFCGMPCDGVGEPLGDEATKTDSETEYIHGKCCPEGDEKGYREP